MAEHVVRKVADLDYRTPAEFVGRSTGYSGDNVVDEAAGAVQMGFRVARLEPGGSVDSHVHSWEESRLRDRRVADRRHARGQRRAGHR